ncbi:MULTISPECIES: mycofactocin-coupled SDR family oxidoreductase [Saccharopolyspora]|uniref:Mycofactocin-coupled SDR family oxidoreductase n=1 Tax=Saccharopolyspora gregorii TaxID=33914 RepID=A0ABP6RL21_9PSEU|nr:MULTISPECIES: mycofactocin-coupled SDR family oxidoreductase [Saccharopolyspora]MCA1191538.1 mycofactocin-coupled SDR family oxidoreductase [Saccharopolyspora sp. 6V]MCA1226306.1 mycofactocin-coupled SDR family oxidoreductase [Saccharopolyspora sp. 6M]MCA1280823.1 mycofactocin-coupled SDR family oxidoreductase [Saccharopolyspora sp. 7B]
MADRMAGKVAFITGAARGQGRSHALRLAAEGADVIAVDRCAEIDSVAPVYSMPTEHDLAETARRVEELGRRAVARIADVRDFDGLQAAFDSGVAELGRVDVVIANAGIVSFGRSWELTAEQWQDMIDVNLTGVFHTAKAAIPTMIEQGDGGCLLLISSVAGLKGRGGLAHYSAAKQGVVGLMQSLAGELGEHGIRVNTIHPTNVSTPMIQHPTFYGMFSPPGAEPTLENAEPAMRAMHVLPTPWVRESDVSDAVAFLAGDEARFVTGAAFPVDAGVGVR